MAVMTSMMIKGLWIFMWKRILKLELGMGIRTCLMMRRQDELDLANKKNTRATAGKQLGLASVPVVTFHPSRFSFFLFSFWRIPFMIL